MRNRVSIHLMLALALVSLPAAAHKPSDSYLTLTVSGSTLNGRWDIALRDLDYALGLDRNDDGAITWGELRARHSDIAAYALSRLTIESNNGPCTTLAVGHLVEDHSDGAYEVLRFSADCGTPMTSLALGYALFFDLDPQHRGLLKVSDGQETHSTIFSVERTTRRLVLGSVASWEQFFDYAREGVWHIWTGFDHVLFLLTLLLPAVLQRRAGRWQAVSGFREAFREVFFIVTSFTVAHSITLSLAVLDVISLPSRLIESVIAASIVFVALNNLYPVITRKLWIVAFGFGLFHGMGFASVLEDLGLPQDALLRALFGFNLGVEIGQLAIVAAFLPLAYLLRRWWLYPRLAVQLGSIAIIFIAAIWFGERAFRVTPFWM